MLNWCIGVAATALVLAVAVDGAETLLLPGEPLPPFSGDTLAGNAITLPAAARGKVALVAFGFSYDSRGPVEAWTEHTRTGQRRRSRISSG